MNMNYLRLTIGAALLGVAGTAAAVPSFFAQSSFSLVEFDAQVVPNPECVEFPDLCLDPFPDDPAVSDLVVDGFAAIAVDAFGFPINDSFATAGATAAVDGSPEGPAESWFSTAEGEITGTDDFEDAAAQRGTDGLLSILNFGLDTYSINMAFEFVVEATTTVSGDDIQFADAFAGLLVGCESSSFTAPVECQGFTDPFDPFAPFLIETLLFSFDGLTYDQNDQLVAGPVSGRLDLSFELAALDYIDFFILSDAAGSANRAPNPVAVPEPSSWALLLLGIVGLGALRRTRDR